jgi:hypothetical protein
MSSGLTCFIVAMGFPSQQADAIRSGYSNSANHTPLSYRGGILRRRTTSKQFLLKTSF